MTVGWGIIGIGKLSDASIAPAITADASSELVAACSRSADRAADFVRRHGGAPYDDSEAMLANDGVQAVYISTPNALHAEHTLAAVRAGKHVLVDKPMALVREDGVTMTEAAAAAGVRLAVGFQLRHKATNIAGRAAIAEGAIGTPVLYELSIGAGKNHFPYDTWRADPALAGGGTLQNQGTHIIDLLHFLSGDRVRDVACLVDAPAPEDLAVVSCRLAGGGLATLASSQVLGGTPRTWRVVGTEGWLEGVGSIGGAPGDQLVLHRGGDHEVLQTTSTNAYFDEVAAFAAAVMGDVPVKGSGDDGVAVIDVIDAVYRSVAQRTVITIG